MPSPMPSLPRRASRSPRTTTTETGVTVIGAPRTTLRDFYYVFLKVRWSGAIAVIVVAYLALNTGFALAYLFAGGVANARPGSFYDALCFSVETMGTVGYGWMYPTSAAANAIMIGESVTSLVVTALATGLIFAKFSRSSARIVFSKHAVIGPMDGVPTLMLRVGNERGNQILEATIRVALVRTEVTKEKLKFYRMYDLRLSRERSPAMSRSWTVLHPIDSDSPLFGASPESVVRDEIEIIVNLVGTDDTSLQPVHARRRYEEHEILWGARHADILTEDEDGNIVVDVRRFHDVHPTEPFDGFPYPAPAAPSPPTPTRE
jgi:inward rectifier potassium channel